MAENLAYLPVVSKPEKAAEDEGKQYCFVYNYDGTDVAAAKQTEEYKTYGVLYNWFAAMAEDNAAGVPDEEGAAAVRGVCPEGWHLPSFAEWRTLTGYVASQLDPVKGNGWFNDLDGEWIYEEGLKNVWSAHAGLEGWEKSGNADTNPDLANGPRDTYGFNMIPSGQCYQTGVFGSFSKSNAVLWSVHKLSQGASTVTFSNNDYELDLSKYGSDPKRAYSVRCIKDAE